VSLLRPRRVTLGKPMINIAKFRCSKLRLTMSVSTIDILCDPVKAIPAKSKVAAGGPTGQALEDPDPLEA
jgi:hypothetical protein